MTLPTPVDVLNRRNRLLFSFLLDGKPDKINRKLICNSQTMGGIHMINVGERGARCLRGRLSQAHYNPYFWIICTENP